MIDVNKIIPAKGQWLNLKITKAIRSANPKKPKKYFILLLMDLVNSLLYRYINRVGRKRNNKIAAVNIRTDPARGI